MMTTEELRLECLKLALAGAFDETAEAVVERAEKYAAFVTGNTNGAAGD